MLPQRQSRSRRQQPGGQGQEQGGAQGGEQSAYEFVVGFLECHFERREIQVKQVVVFSELMKGLWREVQGLGDTVLLSSVRCMVKIVDLVKCNFNESIKNANNICLYFGVIDDCFNKLFKNVNTNLQKQCALALFKLIQPQAQQNQYQLKYCEIENQISKFQLLVTYKNFQELIKTSKLSQKLLTQKLELRFEKIINYMILKTDGTDKYEANFKLSNIFNSAFICLQGAQYLPTLRKLINYHIAKDQPTEVQGSKAKIQQLISVYLQVGEQWAQRTDNLRSLLEQLQWCQSETCMHCHWYLASRLDTQSIFDSGELASFVIATVARVLENRMHMEMGGELLVRLSQFGAVFRRKGLRVGQKIKDYLARLPNLALSLLLKGKLVRYISEVKLERHFEIPIRELQKQMISLSENESSEQSSLSKKVIIANKQSGDVKYNLVALSEEETTKIAQSMQRLFVSFEQSQEISGCFGLCYSGCANNVKQLLGILNTEVGSGANHVKRLLLRVYCPLLANVENVLELRTTPHTNKPSSAIFHMMKMRLLKHQLLDRTLQLTEQQLLQKYYHPICQHFVTVPPQSPSRSNCGRNYHFGMLVILHQSIENTEMLLEHLLRLAERELTDSRGDWRTYASRHRRLISLMANVLSQHNEINVEFCTGAVGRSIELLNKNFEVRHFVNVKTVKQNRLFLKKRYNIARKTESRLSTKLLDSLSNYIDSYIKQCESNSQIMYSPISNPKASIDDNNSFFFILIQLISWCQQNCPNLRTKSTFKHVILQLRHNNSLIRPISIYSILLETIGNEQAHWLQSEDAGVANPEKSVDGKLENGDEGAEDVGNREEWKVMENAVVVLHLLMKINGHSQHGLYQKMNNTDEEMQCLTDMKRKFIMTASTHEFQHPLDVQMGEQVRSKLIRFAIQLSILPSTSTLLRINSILQQKLGRHYLANRNHKSAKQLVKAKEEHLRQCIKKLEMVNFHFTAISDFQLLKVVAVNQCVKAVSAKELGDNSGNAKKNQMQEEGLPELSDERVFEYISALYSLEKLNAECKNQHRLFESTEVYVKAKILSLYIQKLYPNDSQVSSDRDDEINLLTELAKDDIQYIFQRLIFENKVLANVLEREEQGGPVNTERTEEIYPNLSKLNERVFGGQTDLMKCFVDAVINGPYNNGKYGQHQEMSYLIPKRIFNLVRVNAVIRDILAQKLSEELLRFGNEQLLRISIIGRYKTDFRRIQQFNSWQNTGNKLQLKLFVKWEINSKEEHSYRYALLSELSQSKTRSSPTGRKFRELLVSQLIGCMEELTVMDTLTSVYTTSRVLEQILAISVCVQQIANFSDFQAATTNKIKEMLSLLWGMVVVYLGKVVQIHGNAILCNYQALFGITCELSGTQLIDRQLCNVDMNSVVNYFVNAFYHIGKIELIGQINVFAPSPQTFVCEKGLLQDDGSDNLQEAQSSTVSKEKKLPCLGGTQKCIYSCFECNYYNQLCYNCIVGCHSGHPISFVPQSFVIFKTCQCREHKCGINAKLDTPLPSPTKPVDHEKEDDKDGFAERGGSYNEIVEDQQLMYLIESGKRDRAPSLREILGKGMESRNSVIEMVIREEMLRGPSRGLCGMGKMGMGRSLFSGGRPYFLPNKRISLSRIGKRGSVKSGETVEVGEGEGREEEEIDGRQLKQLDYEQSLTKLKQLKEQFILDYNNKLKRCTMNKFTMFQTLLPLFLDLARTVLSQKQLFQCQSKKQQRWVIKFPPQVQLLNRILNPVTNTCKIISTGLQTRLRRHEGPLSPSISKTSFAVDSVFVYILSGNAINIFSLETLYSTLISLRQVQKSPFSYALQMQFEPHSIGVWEPKSIICICGLKNVVTLSKNYSIPVSEGEMDVRTVQFEFSKHVYKYMVSNEYINKMKICKFGIFIGLNRQIRLLSFQLTLTLTIKLPDGLIKQWCVYTQTPTSTSFTVFVTISEGCVMYVEGNEESTGQLTFIQNVTDPRINKPVGSFVTVKNIKNCGTLMLSSYKDKNVGHSFGLLEGNTMKNVNFIKLNNSNTAPLNTCYSMGLTEMMEGFGSEEEQQQPKSLNQLFMVTILKEQLNDPFSIHRGILGILKIQQKPLEQIPQIQKQDSGKSSIQIQLLYPQLKCEYFEVINLKESKKWFVLSLHDDGSLFITMPIKISKKMFENQIALLTKMRKQKNYHSGNNGKQPKNKGEEEDIPQIEQTQITKFKNFVKKEKAEFIKKEVNKYMHPFILDSLPHEHYKYFEGSEPLKPKEDYITAQSKFPPRDKEELMNIRVVNPSKLITGLAFVERCSGRLLTKTIPKTLEMGLTYEQSLWLYSLEQVAIRTRKAEDSPFNREYARNELLDKLKKKRNSEELSSEEKTILERILNKEKMQNITVYGRNLDNQFMGKVAKADPKAVQVFSNKNVMYLQRKQKFEIVLQNCSALLYGYIDSYPTIVNRVSYNFLQFANEVRLKVKPESDYKIYLLAKTVIEATMKIHYLSIGRNLAELHVFNDSHHPLRVATQWKIHQLYEQLSKGQISLNNFTLLIQELSSLCGDIETATSISSNIHHDCLIDIPQSTDLLLCYYIAKYPEMLSKINKRAKTVQLRFGVVVKLIPVYLLGFSVLSYLGYRVQWILSAVSKIVGQRHPSDSQPLVQIPNPYNMILLYLCLRRLQSYQPEGWLKNVEVADVKEVDGESKQKMLKHESFMHDSNFDILNEDLDDEIRQDIQLFQNNFILSNIKIKSNVEGDASSGERENLMEEEMNHKNGLIKRYIDECFREIDYRVDDINKSCERAIALSVICELGLHNFTNGTDSETLVYLCEAAQKSIGQLCGNYEEAVGQNTCSIIMMFLCLFGEIFHKCAACGPQDTAGQLETIYGKAKEEVMSVLSKFKHRIDRIPKVQKIPNTFRRMLQGYSIQTKTNIIYGFISVLQRPCQPNFILLALECYWLFPETKEYYETVQFIGTIREAEMAGAVQKMYDKAVTNLGLWKKVGDSNWLENWVTQYREEWSLALQLLALYYE